MIQIEKLRTTKNKTHILKATISDTGIGMSQNQLPKLFSPFTQLDNSSTKAFSGTGLGLVNSKQLCELMNGIVGVKSQLGNGSTFWFTFEVPEIEPFDINNTEIKNELLNLNFKGLKVLVVDDNSVNRKVATEILKKHNCLVDNAINGVEAIEKVKNNDYGLVLMDIQMPIMDGVTATNKIKGLKLKNIPPIIAMTAYSMKEDRGKYLSQGMDDYIAKPIRVETLLSKLREWISDVDLNKIENIVDNNQIESEEIVDSKVLSQLMKYGGKNGVNEMWQDFEIETTDLISKIKEAIRVENYVELKSCIHTIKGSAGTLGINKVTQIATQFDEEIKIYNYSNIESYMDSLVSTFNEFLRYYKLKS